MKIPGRSARLAGLALALAASAASLAWAQPQTPAKQVSTAEIVRAVQTNPTSAPQLTARVVATGQPENAGTVVGAVVGALDPSDRRALAPTVVTSAIAALPAPQRTPLAPSCACAAVRAVPASEQAGVVPAIVAAAVAMAPQARPQIVACAIAAAPSQAAAIAAAVGPVEAAQLETSGGGSFSSGTSPIPSTSIGIESTLAAGSSNQSCASPPCP